MLPDHMSDANPSYRTVRIYGGADEHHSDDEYWKHESMQNVNYKLGELFKPVFARYNYVSIKTPVGHHAGQVRLNGEWYLKDVISELGLDEGVIEIHACTISGP